MNHSNPASIQKKILNDRKQRTVFLILGSLLVFSLLSWATQLSAAEIFTRPSGSDPLTETKNALADNIIVQEASLDSDGLVNGVEAEDYLVQVNGQAIEIGDYVWQDADSDGIQDGDEAGMSSIEVDLHLDTDGICGNGDETLIGTALTASDGSYYFGGVNNTNIFTSTSTSINTGGGADTAEQNISTGAVSLSSSDLELINDGTDQLVGIRFTNIPILSSAITITNAYIQFTADESQNGTTSLTLHGEANDNSLTFTSTNSDISNRSLTAASTSWPNINPWSSGDFGADQRTPDLSAIVQEIINRPGWAQGNTLTFIISGSGRRTAEQGGAGAPSLIIEYVDTSLTSITSQTGYCLVIDEADPNLGGAFSTPLANYANDTGISDLHDSDGVAGSGTFINHTVAPIQTGLLGENDHTFDFGLYYACTASTDDLGGNIFRDFNNDGANDIGSGPDVAFYDANNPITVYAYDNDNSIVGTAATLPNGTYNFNDIFATNTHIRLEFIGLPSYLDTGYSGADQGTLTQIHTAGTCRADLGVQYSADYCQDNPMLATSCYVLGATSASGTNDVLVQWSYDNSGTTIGDKATIATKDEIGATWGLAYDRQRDLIYSATLLKRHIGLPDSDNDGFGDLEAIYATDPALGTSQLWLDLETLGIDAGTIGSDSARGLNSVENASIDADAFNKVGKVGLGDLDISADMSTLYTVNLFNRTLYTIDVASKTISDTAAIPAPGCNTYSPGIYRINVGSETSYIDSDGNFWRAEVGYRNAATFVETNRVIANTNNDGTTDAYIYQTWHRNGSSLTDPLQYNLPLPNGTYTVRLHYSEPMTSSTGVRLADVTIEGAMVADDFDIVAEAGAINTAIMREYTGISLTDGEFNIEYTNVNQVDNLSRAVVSGIEIVDEAGIGSATASGEYRPFAVKYHQGNVYVGVTCDAEASQNEDDITATVYRYDGTAFTPILTVPLNYTKGRHYVNRGSAGGARGWFPWTNAVVGSKNGGYQVLVYPNPILADIEFDTDGSLILGFIDRHGLQYGVGNYSPDGGELVTGLSAGDILRAHFNGSTYEIESNGVSGGVNGANRNNGQGVGGGEFYDDDIRGSHHEQTNGALALLPGSEEVVTNGYAMLDDFDQGVVFYSNNDGSIADRYQIVPSSDSLFRKGVGLGDLELLCHNAPIEIGNYVWFDSNSNGIQDPSESGDVDVTVTLHDMDNSGTQVGTATTGGNGRYYFGGITDTNMTSGSLLPYRNYEVRVGLADGNLTANTVTTQNANGNSTNDNKTDLADSDASEIGVNAVIAFTTGSGGQNNHTLDFGFRPPSVEIGNQVWSESDQDGDTTTGTISPIVGTVVTATASDGDVFTTTTDSTGHYTFTVPANDVYTVTVGTPPGTAVSVPTGGLIDTDSDPNNDNEIAHDPAGTVVTVTTDDIYTIDFIFHELVEIGNQVWIESDQEGDATTGTITPVTGTVVTATASDGDVFTATTDATGFYTITVPANDTYTVTVGTPDDTAVSVPAGGLIGVDADPNAGNQISHDPSGTVVTVDTNDNYTIDFGFHELVEIGNRVWLEDDGDGIATTGTITPVIGTTVTAIDSNGTVYTATTDSNGFYTITVPANETYTVTVPIPSGTIVSPPPGGLIDTDDDPNSNNNESHHPLGTTVTVTDEDNHTIDFGFQYPPLRLGNLVWYDINNDGEVDASEPPLAGVVVNLLDGNGDPYLDPLTGIALTTTTNISGTYLFEGLLPGTYIVEIALENFDAPGDVLWNFISSLTDLTPDPTTDPDVDEDDNDDNGLNGPDPRIGGVRSEPVTLEVNGEPSADSADEDGRYENNESNLTVDFGFFELLSLGNQIWFDNNDNGIFDSSESSVPAGVILYLLDGDGNPVIDPLTNQPISTTTDINGQYMFTHLTPDDYRVQIGQENFDSGGPLEGYTSSTGSVDPDDDADRDDNGNDTDDAIANGIISDPISLAYNGETTNDEDGDGSVNTNLTVDFGLVLIPTAVELISFTAHRAGEDDIEIRWVTGAEIDNFGFRLMRSSTGNLADAEQIHFEISEVTTGPGASYSYTDIDLEPATYTYWLIDVETTGKETVHGPVTFELTHGYTIHLPLVTNGD